MSDINLENQENLAKDVNSDLKNIRNQLNKKKYDAYDLRFMSSLSEAVLAKSPSGSKKILYLVLFTTFCLITWASFAEVDEITRGQGKIIPSGQNQVVQNLEGGIVEELLVKEGDEVKKGQILLKLDNKSFSSSFGESQIRLNELTAKRARLEAEANDVDFKFDPERDKDNEKAIISEKSLYDTNKAQLMEQISQKQGEIREIESKVSQLRSSYSIVLKEKSITEPLFRKGLVSEVEYLQLQRKLNDLSGELNTARLAIPRLRAAIEEIKLTFKNKAKKELNEVTAEIYRINESQVNLGDRVERTLVRSPVNGIISKMHVHTVSGVIKPGMDIVEIVPLEDTLIAEVKIKPADVAFLRPGLKTMVKFTAYDFSIYGGLEGVVKQISANTETDEKKGESYYLVQILTNKNHLGSEDKPLRIMVGMIVSADIITGKKTVLDYLLKPILKTKQNALRER